MERSGQPIRVACVGLGWVTTHRHIPVMRSDPRFSLIGVIDRRPGRAAQIAATIPGCRSAEGSSLAQVSWLDEVDAITIGTPPMAHHDLVLEAFKLGKDVLTEKPFAMTSAEGQNMVKAAAESGRILSVVHNFQFSRSVSALLRDIATGKIGRIRSLDAMQIGNPLRRLPVWYEELPFGLFYDESPHLLYLLNRMGGQSMKLLDVLGYRSTYGHRTPARLHALCSTTLDQGGEIPVTLRCNFESPVSEWHLSVFGEKHLGIVDIFRDIYLCLPNDGLHDTRTVVRSSVMATWQHWIQHIPCGVRHLMKKMHYGNEEVFSRFAQAVITRTPPTHISGHDALAVLDLQHQIMDTCRMFGRA